MQTTVEETERLEIAGIKSIISIQNSVINTVNDVSFDSINDEHLVEKLTNKIVKKLDENTANYVHQNSSRRFNRSFSNFKKYSNSNKNVDATVRNCWNCNSPSHLIRQCPCRCCGA